MFGEASKLCLYVDIYIYIYIYTLEVKPTIKKIVYPGIVDEINPYQVLMLVMVKILILLTEEIQLTS